MVVERGVSFGEAPRLVDGLVAPLERLGKIPLLSSLPLMSGGGSSGGGGGGGGDPLLLGNLPRVTLSSTKLQLQQTFAQLMRQFDPANPTQLAFPGSQPVSFERRHLNQQNGPSLQTMGFYAAEKTDGVRYMLFILDNKAYAVDRNFEFRILPPMHFPDKSGNHDRKVDRTILDGELVMDATNVNTVGSSRDGEEDQGGGGGGEEARRMTMRFLAYDACVVNGQYLLDQPLPPRLLYLRRDVLAPRFAAAAAGYDFSGEVFTVEQKDFFSVTQLPHIFRNVAPAAQGANWLYGYSDPLRALEHGNDGVIFTPIMEPYQCGTCKTLLKWKPADMNSIDFQLRAVWKKEKGHPTPQPRFRLLIASGGTLYDEPYDWITLSPEAHQRFAADPAAEQRIVECVWDPKWVTEEFDEDATNWDCPQPRLGGWKFERIREDKNLPNDIKTVVSVRQSAKDGVRKEELIRVIGR